MKEKNTIEILNRIKKRSDTLIHYFLFGFFIIGLLLAFYYDTWLIALGVGSSSLIAYYSAKWILRDSDLYQYVLSAVIGVFMAQFIYQMHGMFEMHFFAFIGSALLVVYRNWKLQIPLAVIVILHHAAFGYLQFVGFDKIYFTQLEYMTLQTFMIHGVLTIFIFSICGLWAYNFKKTEMICIEQSFKIGSLQEINVQKDKLIGMSKDLQESNMQLKQANYELDKIFNTVEEILFSVDMVNQRVIHMSSACENIYGYKPADFMSDFDLWMKVIHPDDLHVIQNNDANLACGKTVVNHYRIIHTDQSIHWIEAKVIPTLDKGILIRLDGICNDITEKVKLQNRLDEEKKNRNKEITSAIITAQEKERTFLGEELHDNINPILATVKLYMECAINDELKRMDLLRDSKDFVITAMSEIRSLSKSLVPPSLGDVGLREAISDLVKNMSLVKDFEFITEFDQLDESLLTDQMKLTIYRITQEQLNNIVKHAQARSILISFNYNDDCLELKIKDDGVGFDTTKKKDGVGLQNIRTRTELLNGSMYINSEPGQGCELTICFDLSVNFQASDEQLRA